MLATDCRREKCNSSMYEREPQNESARVRHLARGTHLQGTGEAGLWRMPLVVLCVSWTTVSSVAFGRGMAVNRSELCARKTRDSHAFK